MTELTTPPAPRSRTARTVLIGVAIAVVLAGGGALAYFLTGQPSDTASGGEAFTINGSITLNGSDSFAVSGEHFGAACEGDGGYDDIRAGTQVAVRDPAGAVIALGQLEQGYSSFATCTANFTVTGVPDGHKFYGITVGGRNALQYSKEQLSQRIELTLG